MHEKSIGNEAAFDGEAVGKPEINSKLSMQMKETDRDSESWLWKGKQKIREME